MTLPPLIAVLRDLVPRGHLERVADRAGVAKSALHRWLKGDNTPNVLLFDAVLRACGQKLTITPIDPLTGDPVSASLQSLFAEIDNDFATGGILSEKTMRKLAEARQLIAHRD
jgi:transcriptional regulator with XRE-family HTH domain